MKRNKFTIYGCGGAGINIARQFIENLDKDAKHITPVYLDTSLSNVEDTTNFTRIDGADMGSGGVRAANFDAIVAQSKNILLKHPAGDVALVVFSTAGGSGSTIAPVIARELLASNIPTILFPVVDWSDELRAQNSFNTMRTLDNISRSLDKPVVMIPIANKSRSDANLATLANLSDMVYLLRGDHAELDNVDLSNFLSYNRVTAYPAALASITRIPFVNNEPATSKLDVTFKEPVAVAIVRGDDSEDTESIRNTFTAAYICEGIAKDARAYDGNVPSNAFVITFNEANDIRTVLDAEMERYMKQVNAAVGGMTTFKESEHARKNESRGDFVL